MAKYSANKTKNKHFSVLYPKEFRDYISGKLVYAGNKNSLDDWLANLFLLNLISLIILSLALLKISKGFSLWHLAIFTASLVFIHGLQLISLEFQISRRRRQAEDALPDMLQLIAANLRAGMTPSQAIKASLRPEFGILSEEFSLALSRSMGTESFDRSLSRINEKIDSELLKRTITLFTAALKAGGNIALMLEKLAEDMVEVRELKEELVTNTKTSSMFISFMLVIGAPILLSVSLQFVKMINKLQASSMLSNSSSLGMSFSETQITVQFMTIIAITLLIVSSLLASILSGVISEGNFYDGLKTAPLLAAVSLILFFIAQHFMSGLGI